jgi:hypothetical protein
MHNPIISHRPGAMIEPNDKTNEFTVGYWLMSNAHQRIAKTLENKHFSNIK